MATKKQTAVEHLIEQIKIKADSITTNTKENRIVKGIYVDCLIMAKQAKQMEKEQIVEAYNHCIKDRYKNALVDCGFKEKSEKGYNTGTEYYNETYGNIKREI